MAESDELSVEPGNGMKMTVFGIKKKFPSVKNINTATLSSWMRGWAGTAHDQTSKKERLVILDARPAEEYEVSHIPGAIRVDHSKRAEEILSDIPDQNLTVPSKIVCYCSVGYRSSVVAEKLSRHCSTQDSKADTEIYNLEGSIFQWANEGRSMVDGQNQPTKYAHPYNTFFGMLLNTDLKKTKL